MVFDREAEHQPQPWGKEAAMTSAQDQDRADATATVVSVSVGGPRDVDRNGRPAKTAIWKTPVTGRVQARGVNLDGDDQADRRAHGGPDKAIYAYSSEDRSWWETDLGRSIEVGGFGENLTTEGIDLTSAVVGEQWRVGSTLLEVSEPRVPCWRLNLRMDDRRFIQRFAAAGRPGTYLRIVEEGDIGAGDSIEVVAVPDHSLTVGEVARIFHHDHPAAGSLLGINDLSDAWTAWAQRMMSRHDVTAGPCPGCE